MLQALTDSDHHTTVLSMDGISAFDMISRRAMLEALQRLPGGEQVLPYVRLFYGRQSTYLWDDDIGVVDQIPQGEGGEQGDPHMPLLFARGIHASSPAKLAAVGQARLRVSCVCWQQPRQGPNPDPLEASGVRLASRWAAILSCAAARAVACSLLNIQADLVSMETFPCHMR